MASLKISDPLRAQSQFLSRFRGRTIICHAGFPPGWFEELLKQPGGGGHFRIDLRNTPHSRPTPIEWVVYGFVAPLALPLPLVIKVDEDALHIRHLIRNGGVGHPSEILWILDDIRDRYHVRLEPEAGGFRARFGISISDNAIETPYDTL